METQLHNDTTFIKLLLAIGVNAFAFFLDFVAVQALVIFQWNQGPLVAALVTMLYAAPRLLVSPWAGAIADRFRQDRILVGSIASLAGLSAIQFFSTSTTLLLALLIVKNIVRTFLMPACMSYLRHSLHRAKVPRALALVSTIQESSKVLGPALSGMLLLMFQPISLYLVVAALYVIALLAVATLPDSARPSSNWPDFRQLWGDLSGSLQSLLAHPNIKRVALTALAFTFAIFFSDNLITVLSHRLGITTSGYAAFCSAVGVGGIIAAVAVARWTEEMAPLAWLKLAIVIDAAVYLAIGMLPLRLVPSSALLSTLLLLGVFRGIASALQYTALAIYVQSQIEPELAGRAHALHTVIYGISMLAAPLLGNGFFRLTSFTATFAATAMLMLLSLIPLALLLKATPRAIEPS